MKIDRFILQRILALAADREIEAHYRHNVARNEAGLPSLPADGHSQIPLLVRLGIEARTATTLEIDGPPAYEDAED